MQPPIAASGCSDFSEFRQRVECCAREVPPCAGWFGWTCVGAGCNGGTVGRFWTGCDVEYEVLPPLMTIEDALADPGHRIHDYGSRGNVHKEDEYIETAPVSTGLSQLLELTLVAAEDLAAGR